MPFAYNLTREAVHYRHATFTAGLERAGYKVSRAPPGRAAPGDVLLIWNRYGYFHDTATQFEQQGGSVVVAENGYIGRDERGEQLFAMALRGHNGSGVWPDGDGSRFEKLRVDLLPWGSMGVGDKIVVRGQRGIGAPGMASPPGWHVKMRDQLQRMTRRPVQVVEHPGNGAERNLAHYQYLKGAHALVIWSSSVGVKALALGVPVLYGAPHWICGPSAAWITPESVERPPMDDALRLGAMRSMAWAQWRLAEIASGEAFVELLKCSKPQ